LDDSLSAQSDVVSCGAAKGEGLLAAKGPDVGGQLYDWHCRKQAANALRRTPAANGGGQARGHFLLAGGHVPRLLAASLQPPATASKSCPASGASGFGVWPAVLQRNDVVERLRGEAAALEQWLWLAQEVAAGPGDASEAGCAELQPQPLAAKRSQLTAAIALMAVLDVGFDPRATFQVLHAASNAEPSGSGGQGDPVAVAWPLGLYLEQRGK
jgi:hypothetical protein